MVGSKFHTPLGVELEPRNQPPRGSTEKLTTNTMNTAKLKPLNWRKTPMCEILGNLPSEHFTYRRGKWLFVSTEADEDWNEYHFPIAGFFATPASTTEWLAHLSEKRWFDPKDFFEMIHRFRKATDSYFALQTG
jgi:hypothetical protein